MAIPDDLLKLRPIVPPHRRRRQAAAAAAAVEAEKAEKAKVEEKTPTPHKLPAADEEVDVQVVTPRTASVASDYAETDASDASVVLAACHNQRRIFSLVCGFSMPVLTSPLLVMTAVVVPPVEAVLEASDDSVEPSAQSAMVVAPPAPSEYLHALLAMDFEVPTPPTDVFDKEYFVSDAAPSLFQEPPVSRRSERAAKRKANETRDQRNKRSSYKAEIILRFISPAQVEDSSVFRDLEALTAHAGDDSPSLPAPIPSDEDDDAIYALPFQFTKPTTQRRKRRSKRSDSTRPKVNKTSKQAPQDDGNNVSHLGAHADSLFAAENLFVSSLSDSELTVALPDSPRPAAHGSFPSDTSLFGMDEISTLQSMLVEVADIELDRDTTLYDTIEQVL